MKKWFSVSVLLVVLLSPGLLQAQTDGLFQRTPPAPEAETLLTTYLPLLSSGHYQQALSLTDLRGMRHYLLERRLADLKTRNPGLTAENLMEISAAIQLNDLAPGRLQAILLDMLQSAGYQGMTWNIRGYAPPPPPIEGYVANVETLSAQGQSKTLLLGLKQLGEEWVIAPEITEALSERMAPPPVAAREVPTPQPVSTLVDDFWTAWKEGDMERVYALYTEDYRRAVSLLAFLEQAQALGAHIGGVLSWEVTHSRKIGPNVLGIGANIQGTKGASPVAMVFRQMGETWVLENAQFQPPRAAPTPPPPMAPPNLRPNLAPNLAPAIGPLATPPEAAVPAFSPPVQIGPDAAPIGPDGP
ncbi:MAG: hypothetical protein LBN38_07580 [Verrucomicrobiota bacterium]|jgi:hypothetical protein|nr:hypothetical protein [Verrucomicrobiota bacterium]